MLDVEAEALSSMPKQRVTAKGANVPEPITAFRDLSSRYDVTHQLLQNLAQYGYHSPTGIQAHGVPVLLEVKSIAISGLTRTDGQFRQSRDLAAISPTGTGKTLSYLLPTMSLLKSPASSGSNKDTRSGVRALILAPTRELSHQIYNECLKLAQGRKWRVVLFSKATASTLADKNVRDKVGT